jgi:hypothetical protein
MALFPKIESCPYVDRFDQVMDGDFCRMCKRQVHDLTDMDDSERIAFLASCGGEACVSQRFPVRPVMAAAALTVTAALVMAAAPPVGPGQNGAKDGEAIKTITVQPEVPMLAGIVAFPVEMRELPPVEPVKKVRKAAKRRKAPRRA